MQQDGILKFIGECSGLLFQSTDSGNNIFRKVIPIGENISYLLKEVKRDL